jgi:hypothetical protein
MAILVNITLSIDLSQPWTPSNVSANANGKPPTMLHSRRPIIWYNPFTTSVYEWAGWTEDAAVISQYQLWTFIPDGHGSASWSLSTPPSTNEGSVMPTFGSAWAASTTELYSLGGAEPISGSSSSYNNGYNFPTISLFGLITVDLSSNTWHNVSSAGASPSGYLDQSQAVFVPNFGTNGLFVVLGGDTPPNQTYYYQAGESLAPMSNVVIYDVESDNWYVQTATGDVPPPRSEFCMVGASSSGNSSYEM